MSQFNPYYLLKNKHLQSMYAPLFRSAIPLKIESEVFELSDGDFVECYWLDKPTMKSKTPIVVLFHGLEGSFKSAYIQGMMQALQAKGFASVLMHFRGCSGKDNRLPRSYHSGDTEDARAWIAHLAKEFPNAPLFAVGYSLGANMLLKLLGEESTQSKLTAAVAISAPMTLSIGAKVLNQGIGWLIYQRYLLGPLKQKLIKKYHRHDMEKLLGKSIQQIKQLKTLREFDDVYTSKINGFENAEDYYAQSSAKQYLAKIATKTLIIYALDDPFMTPEVLPNDAEISSSIELEVHKNGGHVGFVSGSLFKPEYYLETRVPEFFQSILE